MQLYAITDRRVLASQDPGAPSLTGATRPATAGNYSALIQLTRRWAAQNIHYIQIREKDLAPDDLLILATQIVAAVRTENQTTRVLLNGPANIALEAAADGVHLPGNMPQNAAAEARDLFARSGRDAILSHACHSVNEVLAVREDSQRNPHATTANTLILFAPVFEKVTPTGTLPGLGLDTLRAAVHAAKNIPVLALGGITPENTPACLAAGAAGVAGIRLFLGV